MASLYNKIAKVKTLFKIMGLSKPLLFCDFLLILDIGFGSLNILFSLRMRTLYLRCYSYEIDSKVLCFLEILTTLDFFTIGSKTSESCLPLETSTGMKYYESKSVLLLYFRLTSLCNYTFLGVYGSGSNPRPCLHF